MSEVKPKEPLLAVMLSILLPGLGHIYAKKTQKGVVLFVSIMIAEFLFVTYLFSPHTRIMIGSVILGIVLVLFGVFIIIDSFLSAKTYNMSNNLTVDSKKGKKVIIVIACLFFLFVFNPGQSLIAFPLAMYVRGNIVQSFKVPTATMQPTLMVGDAILVDKAIYHKEEPKRGDVVVFVYPEDPRKNFIKRIVGMPGETLEIKNGKVLINGIPLTEPAMFGNIVYFNRGEYGAEGKVTTIPKDAYYVLGDNSVKSQDSRYWGFVPRQNLVGKAYKIYFPFSRSGQIK